MTSGGAIDIGDWLRGLGLGQYEASFRQNEVNESVLPKLTQEDLKEIGVTSCRRRHSLTSCDNCRDSI